ncbi:cytochrome c oxidase assembly protein [Neobacillus terrae]|uniref:cytochrome c oxidase assembly protein n=1 Tax=Neobacillus terrae TaxID=3034837 RepID=UPI0014092E87|nr:cytochrome c oxidase assembly protein [Neobacillus terrae]NHM31263.1 cytochrome c oxidase assembly protein [Neobacillus terrae]
MSHNHDFSNLLWTTFLASGILVYVFAGLYSSRKLKNWPIHRYIFWIIGTLSLIIGAFLMGKPSHHSFGTHMLIHLLIGMISPLFLVLSAPMTLILKSLNVSHARIVTCVLKSKLINFFINPFVAAVMNAGGLWLLYTTGLYTKMQASALLHVLVHLHLFLAGYLSALSIIYIDPVHRRYSFKIRAIVLVATIAAHDILSKFIYAHPPKGVSLNEAHSGAMLMYYGGDAVELIILIVLCYQWFKAEKPRKSYVLANDP